MHVYFQPIINALESLDSALSLLSFDKRSFLETSGWTFPAVDKLDLLYAVRDLRSWVLENAPDEEQEFNVAEIAKRIQLIESNVLPYISNGNGAAAIPNFFLSLQAIKTWLSKIWPERQVLAPDALPSKLARQARTAKQRLDGILNDADDIEEKLKVITDAHAAAEALPTDLEELKQLRAAMLKATTQTSSDQEMIATNRVVARDLLAEIKEASATAAKLVKQCEDAYQITTTKGLSAAFSQRAFRLGVSMWVWVVGLLLALGAVALIGHERITALTALISGDPKWGVVILNFLLTAFSVGAPLWFAWVATKQVGQRFRMAEDYAFKASVAKAYEGYRREAVRIDPKFEAQLFSIALQRLEEAPLRMIENESHGSPYHELISEVLSNAKDPGFCVQLGNLFKAYKSEKKDSLDSSSKATPEAS